MEWIGWIKQAVSTKLLHNTYSVFIFFKYGIIVFSALTFFFAVIVRLLSTFLSPLSLLIDHTISRCIWCLWYLATEFKVLHC